MCQNASALQLWSCRFWVVYKSWRLCCFSGLVSCCSCWCQWNCAGPVQQAGRPQRKSKAQCKSFCSAGGGRGGSCLLTLRCRTSRDPALRSQGCVPANTTTCAWDGFCLCVTFELPWLCLHVCCVNTRPMGLCCLLD